MHARRHGLLIGIDRYPCLPGRDLSGCVNDARLMHGLLTTRFGFPAENLELLLDEAASRDGILGAMDRLRARVGEGDEVVVFYAGHGSRIALDEGGYLESMVAADSGRGDDDNRDVLDYEVDAFVRGLNAITPQVTLLFDCCHSGSVTRDVSAVGVRQVPLEARSLAAIGRMPAPKDAAPAGARTTVLLAACQANQLAAEYRDPDSGAAHGALTWYLARTLATVAGGATWRDVYRAIAPKLTARFPRQQPLVEGHLDRQIFAAEGEPQVLSLAVLGREGEHVVLSGGSLMGVTAGSRWRLSPTVTTGTPVEVTVTSAEPLKARALAPAEVETGWRAEALELRLPSPGMTIRVEAPVDRASALINEVQRSNRPKLLHIVEAEADADLVAYLLAPRVDGGPCPALGALDAETWAVVGRDGRLAVKARAASAGVEGLVDDLLRVARFQGLLLADAPDQSAELQAGVSLEVRPRGQAFADGVIPEGTPCDLLVHNRTRQPVYVTLLEFGTDMAIQSMLPMAGHPDDTTGGVLVEAGQTLDLARDYFSRDDRFDVADGLPLHLPDAFPWAAEPGEGGGIGHLAYRLLVTRERADFSFLEQAGTRTGAAVGGHPLADRLGVFHSGQGSRGFLPRAKAEAGPAPFAIVDQVVQVRGKPTREIPPGTGGKVMAFKILVGGVKVGTLAATTPDSSGKSYCHWTWAPKPGKAFTLDTPELLDKSKVEGFIEAARWTNPEFDAGWSSISSSSQVQQWWDVHDGGTLVAHMALAGNQLRWFGKNGQDRLPAAKLTFALRSGPPTGAARHAIDVPA